MNKQVLEVIVKLKKVSLTEAKVLELHHPEALLTDFNGTKWYAPEGFSEIQTQGPSSKALSGARKPKAQYLGLDQRNPQSLFHQDDNSDAARIYRVLKDIFKEHKKPLKREFLVIEVGNHFKEWDRATVSAKISYLTNQRGILIPFESVVE